MSLDEIGKEKNISRELLTYLREFYGIKRKGATYQRRIKNEKPLSQKAKDIIIGSLLGDGHLTKWGYFSEKHSPAQLEYLQWKASFMEPITTEKSWSYYENVDKRSGSLIKTHSFRTITHSWLQEMEKLFYKEENGKRTKVVPHNIDELMNEKVLAVWFMDDGKTNWPYRKGIKTSPNANPISTFCTDSFSIEEIKLLQKILLSKFDLDSTMNIYRHRINLTTTATSRMIDLFKNKIHDDLFYKINEEEYKTKNNIQ